MGNKKTHIKVTIKYHIYNLFNLFPPEPLIFNVTRKKELTRREARLLLGNAEQRYRWFCKEYPELLERIPQYHIASFLGITPVSLSRLRKK